MPIEGWDFSWFDGRATEARPLWGYARPLADAAAGATRPRSTSRPGAGRCSLALRRTPPPLTVATEGWPPNVAKATALLRPPASRSSPTPTSPAAVRRRRLRPGHEPAPGRRRSGPRSPACCGPAARTSPSTSVRRACSSWSSTSSARSPTRSHGRRTPTAPAPAPRRRARHRRPADGAAAHRVPRRRRRGVVPAEGGLDGPRLHRRGVPRPPRSCTSGSSPTARSSRTPPATSSRPASRERGEGALPAWVAGGGGDEYHLVQPGVGVGVQPLAHGVEVADQSDPLRGFWWYRGEQLVPVGPAKRHPHGVAEARRGEHLAVSGDLEVADDALQHLRPCLRTGVDRGRHPRRQPRRGAARLPCGRVELVAVVPDLLGRRGRAPCGRRAPLPPRSPGRRTPRG